MLNTKISMNNQILKEKDYEIIELIHKLKSHKIYELLLKRN